MKFHRAKIGKKKKTNSIGSWRLSICFFSFFTGPLDVTSIHSLGKHKAGRLYLWWWRKGFQCPSGRHRAPPLLVRAKRIGRGRGTPAPRTNKHQKNIMKHILFTQRLKKTGIMYYIFGGKKIKNNKNANAHWGYLDGPNPGYQNTIDSCPVHDDSGQSDTKRQPP